MLKRIVSVRGDEELPSFAMALDSLGNRGEVPSVFDYRFAQVTDPDGMYLWALRLWEYFTIFVGHHDPNDAMKTPPS